MTGGVADRLAQTYLDDMATPDAVGGETRMRGTRVALGSVHARAPAPTHS